MRVGLAGCAGDGEKTKQTLRRAFAGHLASCIGELSGAGDHGDGPHHPLSHIVVRKRAENLDRQLRDAVAVILKQQLLEHDVGGAAIGRNFSSADLCLDESVGLLILIAEIDPIGDVFETHEVTIGPDAANAGDRPLAERDSERNVVAIGHGGDARAAALAAALLFLRHLFAEVRGPDNIAAQLHAAMHARDHRPLGRGGDRQGLESLPLDPLIGLHRGDDHGVHDRTDSRADHAANGRARQAKEAAAKDCRPERLPGNAKCQRCHRLGCLFRVAEGIGDAPCPTRV